MSGRHRSRRKRISSGRKKKTRRLSQKGGDGGAKLGFADTHHLAHQISSRTKNTASKATQNFDRANDELATAIQEGVARGKQIYKDVSEAPAREVGRAMDKKAEALREQGKNAAAESVEASKEMAEEEVQAALGAIAQKEVGFVENMTAATAAEIVSEVPGVGPLAGEAIEGVYNQGKAVFDAKAEFDAKMDGIREKAAALEAKKEKLAGLAANSQDAVAGEAKAALQNEIDGHEAELSKDYGELAQLEKRLEKEVQEFTALARDSRVKVYDNINRLNKLVVQAGNSKLTDSWESVLASLEDCVKADGPDNREHALKEFEKQLKEVAGMEELGEKQSEFKKLAAKTTSILEQGLDLHHGSKSKPKSEGGKGGTSTPITTEQKLERLQSRRQALSEARKRLRRKGVPV